MGVHEAPPEPMLLPDTIGHLINGDALGLGQQADGEGRHDHNPARKEEEHPRLHAAQH